MQRHLRLIMLTTLLGAACAQAADVDPHSIAASAVLGDRYPERRIQFPSHVVSDADLVYSTLEGYRPLRLDLYRVEDSKQPRPLVIHVHGGGWQGGHTRQSGAFENFPGVLASLAARGYVVASLEYRLSGEARFPAQIQDVKAAIRWLREHATEFGIDPTRAGIWGGSAGGQLAGLAGMSCGVAALEPPPSKEASGPVDPKADCVQAVVSWYGIFDFATLAKALHGFDTKSAPGRYLGCTDSSCDAQVVSAASAITYVDATDPPVLLVHGVDDRTVPIDQSRDFYKLLRAKGVKAELVEIPGVGHSFIGKTQPVTRDASLQALDKTFEFFDRTLKAQ
jgi:acetyl esterase/lipase